MKEKIYVFLHPDGARNCGHVGLIFEYEDGSVEKIYQSAVEPRDSAFKLILFKQPMKVIIQKIVKYQYFKKVVGSAKYFRLKTKYFKEIRSSVDIYKEKNKPYNSITNNCGHFIHEVLKVAPDIKSKKKLIPKKYFLKLRKLNK